MIDIHAPHETVHTWRDFFIHIATIVVGLLIAVGLEQGVEAIHAAHERKDLRVALQRENEQILHDAHVVDIAEGQQIVWLQGVELQIAAAAHDSHPVGAFPKQTALSWDVPDNPIFAAAKASARLARLRDEELVAYGELDALIGHVSLAYTHLRESRRNLDNFVRSATFDQPGTDLLQTRMTPEQLRDFHTRFVQIETATKDFRYWSRQAEGAATVMRQGELNLHKIEVAERMFDKNP